MKASVLSYSEEADLAGEVAWAGVEVAKMLGGDAAAVELDEVSGGLNFPGRVVLAKGERKLETDADSAAAAIVDVARGQGPRAILVGATRFGRVVAAKVAARLSMGSLGEAERLQVEGERLVATREVYAGKFLARVAARLPCVALVQPGAYAAVGGSPQSVETVSVTAGEPRVTLREMKETPRTDGAGIESAAVIVSAGRGFSKKEDLALAYDLARTMGAAVGCSRPLSSDLGWLGEEHHIGLTGAYVHPQLYVAVGISGQLQHIAGIKDSKIIVAINKDRQAPIFQVADYGIVGDLYEVLPVLTKILSPSA